MIYPSGTNMSRQDILTAARWVAGFCPGHVGFESARSRTALRVWPLDASPAALDHLKPIHRSKPRLVLLCELLAADDAGYCADLVCWSGYALNMRLAAIDVGSNSVHMVIADVGAEGRLEVVDRVKEMVRLGRRSFTTGRLADSAMDLALRTLKNFRRLAELHKVARIRAVATSAVRE